MAVSNIAYAIAPTHTAPLLQEVGGNLTGTNQTGTDADGDAIVFNYNWYHKDILNSSRWINDSSLMVNFPFDSNSTQDFARFKINATVFGDVGVATGIVNDGIQFDGTGDYLELTPNGSNNFSVQNYTITAWVYMRTAEAYALLWSYDFTSHTQPYYAQHLRVDAESGLVYLGFNKNDGVTVDNIVTSSGLINISRWYFIAAYHGIGSQKIFIDGMEQASGTATSIVAYYEQEVWIGNSNYGVSVSSIIDELRFYNRTLTGAEINQSYMATRDKFAQINTSRYTGTSADYKIEMTPYDSKESGTPLNNSLDIVAMNLPKNNSITHNKSITFNFTVDDPTNNKINYTLWADTNLTPDTNINQTLNVTQGTFIFNYTFGIEINGSINGTYYWKVNGTDNNSNNFRSSIFTFNITNNISAYNVTNVSITPLPLEINTEAKCYFNLTNKNGQNDTISISDQRWWLNNTLVAEAGNKTLSANNVTLNSNITCEARINNGYGQTAWTEYVNSSKVTVADTVAPILNNCTLSSTSITDASGNTINLTCDATDAISNIQTMVASLNGTINKTLTFSFTQSRNIISSYIIFESLETLSVGAYSINQVNVTDTSSNKLSNTTKDLHFTVTSAPSGGGTPSGGGGGGGMPFIPSCSAGEVLFSNKCVNSSSFNQTFKITSLQNIDQIVFITSCFSGEKSEFRTAIKTNKLIGSASFEKPQPSFNINIDKSDLIVTRKLDLKNRISQRIDAGSIRIISSVGEVARANLAIRAINICSAIPLSPQKIKGDVGARRLFFDISEVNKINFIKGILIFPLIVIIIFGGMGAYLYKKTSNKTS